MNHKVTDHSTTCRMAMDLGPAAKMKRMSVLHKMAKITANLTGTGFDGDSKC